MLESVGHYKILDRIGAGGIGEVYRARDTKLGRTVAIEVLSPEMARNPERRSRVRPGCARGRHAVASEYRRALRGRRGEGSHLHRVRVRAR